VTFVLPWDAPAPPIRSAPTLPTPARAARSPGRRPAAPAAASAPDWLYHHLTITGPAADIALFAAAARGAGVVPWRLDLAAIEEDVFLLAVAQPAAGRPLGVAGCRILARQFADAVAARQAEAAARAVTSRACPFDLQRLLPVPAALLERGPGDPAARAWLAAHWGCGELRRIVLRPDAGAGRRLPRGHGVLGYGFFTDGPTPHAAIAAIAAAWPGLRFALRPRPAD
jgi:hypothetical protein